MPDESLNRFRSEWFSEIRYEPLGRFLNFKGSIADRIKAELSTFKHWRIGENRVDFHNEEGEEDLSNEVTAFVGFKSIGYSLSRPDTKDYFPQQVNKFIRTVFDENSEFLLPPVTRIGLRAYVVVPFDGDFDALNKIYVERLVGPFKEIQELFGNKISDAGISLDFFKKGRRSAAFKSGPMKLQQMESIFKVEDDLPDVGLFFDIDVFKSFVENPESIDLSQVCREISDLSESLWRYSEGLEKIIQPPKS